MPTTAMARPESWVAFWVWKRTMPKPRRATKTTKRSQLTASRARLAGEGLGLGAVSMLGFGCGRVRGWKGFPIDVR